MRELIKKLTNFVRANRKEVALLFFILLIASFLRLYRIEDYLTFLGDEGRDVLVVKRMIVDHKFTLLGPTASVGGFFLGPIYYYLMTPFLWVFNLNPVGPAVMVALFGVATVFLIHKVGRDFFNYKVGLLAAGLYSISPLVIAYSRSSWNPNLMPFFSLLIIWLTWRFMVQKNLKLFGLIGFFFGILIQLHYLATFLMVVVGAYLFLFSKLKKKITFYALGMGGFLAGWSPFLLFELRHRFPNFKSLYGFLLHGDETGFVFSGTISKVIDIFTRLFSRLITNNEMTLAFVLLFVSLVVFFVSWRKSKRKPKEKPIFSLLGLWLLLGVFLFIFYQDPVYDYYLGFMFPLPFLISAFALEKTSRSNKIGLAFSILVIVWLVAVNLKGAPFRYEPNRQLDQARKVAKTIFDKAEGRPFNFALITGGNSDHAYRYFLEVWGNSPITVENDQVDPEKETVTDQLFVVCEILPCHPLGHSLWEIAGFGRAEIVDQWEASVVEVYQLKAWEGEE